MELKEYQKRVVDEVERYLRKLAEELAGGNRRHAAKDAWEDLRIPGRYTERRNGLGEDLPSFYIKVPTGGGKTLLATQILGLIHRTILRDRNGSGLVLWIVPSSQIYRDTLKRLRDRSDMYRIMLEHALSRRIEVWEKDEITRLTPARLRDCLNILVLQLASTNRETKEQLKFFRDSGGNIVQHFPAEDDAEANRALKANVPNLEMIQDEDGSDLDLVKTSVGNLVRLCQPAVVLDEGHRATSQLAQQTIEGFNASIVVELSATPPEGANILCKVSGEELLKEQMIKLPLNVVTSGVKKWQDVLTRARDKRDALARKAAEYESNAGPAFHIRPIVLVQVQRTGSDQREKNLIHADHVREYLQQNLGIHESAIKVQSAEDPGLEDIDLLEPGCPVEWIITKSALQEGWDCPFAYVLVSLDNTGSGRAMTQLVGRVLRQPHQTRTPIADLNESYAYCLHPKPAEVLRHVKKALEDEGYEGEAHSLVASGERDEQERPERVTPWRAGIADLYTRPFKGKIYLPHFCVKEGKDYAPLDYFEHLISRVDVDRFEYAKIDWPLAEEIRKQKERGFRVTLGQEPSRQYETEIEMVEDDDRVLSWLVANLNFPYLSFKQLRRIVQRTYARLVATELPKMVDERLAAVKTEVRNRLSEFIVEQLDKQTEKAFDALFDDGKILFYLQCAECRFEMPETIRIESTSEGRIELLTHDDGGQIAQSLFEHVDRESMDTDYERQVALVLDRDANVLWWYRNRVGADHFKIQGYKRARIHPDFVVQGKHDGREFHRVLVIESKGEHLEGNPDTVYKRKVSGYFNRAGARVTWQQLGMGFKDHVFRFQILDQAQPHGRDWQDELGDLLAATG